MIVLCYVYVWELGFVTSKKNSFSCSFFLNANLLQWKMPKWQIWRMKPAIYLLNGWSTSSSEAFLMLFCQCTTIFLPYPEHIFTSERAYSFHSFLNGLPRVSISDKWTVALQLGYLPSRNRNYQLFHTDHRTTIRAVN